MKLNYQENEVLTNSTKESKFTINASAQAFRILSDGIYEHKIPAIVRELSCNAYDAHAEAGNLDQPFKVVLPNALHPYFEIEDFGVGLDDDGVRTVYTSYFTSTKQNSNDAIGAFGLGSKTPFSYTNTFNIRARKDGVERLYSAYIGSDGAPAVNMLAEHETQEGNGVKITVPVKDSDFSRFKYEAQFILSMFKVKPIVPDPTFEFLLEGVAEELETGKIVVKQVKNNLSQLYNSRLYAVMGGVCYGLDWNTIAYSLDKKYFDYINKVVLGGTSYYSYSSSKSVMFLQFEIGELEPAASRETLSMTEDTESLVTSRLEQAVDFLIKEDQVEVESKGHPIKAIKFIEEKYNMGNMILSMFTYKDKPLINYSNKVFDFFRHISAVSGFYLDRRKAKSYTVVRLEDFIPKSDIDHINVVYVPEGSAMTGFVKYSKLHLESLPTKSRLITLKNPISERVKKRFEQYIGIEVKWISLDDLKEEYKETLPSNTVSNSSSYRKVTDKPKKVEIFGKCISYCAKKHHLYNLGAKRVDCMKEKMFYVDDMITNSYEEKVRIIGDNRSLYITFNDLEAIFNSLGLNTEIVIMKRNVNNEGKMNTHNIKPISVLIEQFKKDISVSPKEIALQSMYNARGRVGGLNIHEIYEKSNPNLKVEGYETEVIPKDQLSILTSLFEKEVDQERNNIDAYIKTNEAKDLLRSKYPLLDHVSGGYDVYDHIKYYIALVDSTSEEV